MMALSPVVIVFVAALLVWAINERVRSFTQGMLAVVTLMLALTLAVASQFVPGWSGTLMIPWSTFNGQPLRLGFAATELPGFFGIMLLLAGTITAGSLAWTLGRTTRIFGLVFAGLLVLIGGGLLTMYSASALGAIAGLGVAWLGGTVMQQATTAHNREATFGGLALLMLVTALLIAGATPELRGGDLAAGPWIAGCMLLMGLAPRWGTTRTAPLLVRAPVITLGLPLLGGFLFLRHATSATWSSRLTFIVLLLGVVGFGLGAVNALVARRFGNAFAWQMIAQFALVAIVFGTGQPAAPPMAAGLLAHTLITGTALALAIGQLERATRTDEFAVLPPLPQPLRRAGIAYGLAAVSCAGLPPLLGYALRRVVLVLAQSTTTQPWLPPVLLATSSLLALSFLPTLVAFFRRPAFKSPLITISHRGGGWPLALMIGLLLGGLVPDQAWQYILGDASVAAPQMPPPPALAITAASAVLALIVFGLINRALRHPRPQSTFMGGEPLDEEPGWTLPFTALRTVLRPLIIPERAPGQALGHTAQQQRERLTDFRQGLERRYYLAVVVVSLIAVLLLATQ